MAIQQKFSDSTKFVKKLLRNIIIGLILIVLSLYLGMLGYHHYEKMSWVDAYVNAAMILSGMGPVAELKTSSGKIFAGSYALFSGIFFLVIMAIIAAPVVHHFLKRFHVEDKVTK